MLDKDYYTWNTHIENDENGTQHYICDWQSDEEEMNRKFDYKVSLSLEKMIDFLNNTQAFDLLSAICYTQDKYNFFMSGKSYKKFKRFINSEHNSCKNNEQDNRRIIKNIFKRFNTLCKLESLPFALSLAMNAQIASEEQLKCICDLRIIIGSPLNYKNGNPFIIN